MSSLMEPDALSFLPSPATFCVYKSLSDIAAAVLKRVWGEYQLPGDPLIFSGADYRDLHIEHHPVLLNQLIKKGQKSRARPGQLLAWDYLSPPAYAQGVVWVPYSGELLAPHLQVATYTERHPIPDALTGWIRYRFSSGWDALSVRFMEQGKEALVLVAVPAEHLGEWQAFLQRLDSLHKEMLRRRLRGRIQIIGAVDEKLEEVIGSATFHNVILPDDVLAQVAAQRCIFEQSVLARYKHLSLPRLRKVLLVGPPGTGKTSLLKAEGACHAKQGGLVLYVPAPERSSFSSAWENLSEALNMAANNRLPTLVLVEDFELFVSDKEELQRVLNTLDGVTTPDNPAGTLLLATSNHPESLEERIRDRPGRVDVIINIGLVEDLALGVRFLQHFLGASYREEHAAFAQELLRYPGSYFREVCLTAAILALGQEREEVSLQDLRAAHQRIQNGRTITEKNL